MVANRAVARRSGEQNPAYEPAHPHLGLWPGRLALADRSILPGRIWSRRPAVRGQRAGAERGSPPRSHELAAPVHDVGGAAPGRLRDVPGRVSPSILHPVNPTW